MNIVLKDNETGSYFIPTAFLEGKVIGYYPNGRSRAIVSKKYIYFKPYENINENSSMLIESNRFTVPTEEEIKSNGLEKLF